MIALKPEILMMPTIPVALHGISPRTINGDTWWNKTRKEVYNSTDNHCICCGKSKENASLKRLEAHEYYNIDYNKFEVSLIEIVPLCHYCHNFIHSGRLSMIIGSEKSEYQVKQILEHGFKILSENNLKCFPFTLEFGKILGCNTYNVQSYNINLNSNLTDLDWKFIYNGKIYK
jgi:hypothetical protein